MSKNLDVSDSNNILKTLLVVLIVGGIAYLIYYLYNQQKGNNVNTYEETNNRRETVRQEIESPYSNEKYNNMISEENNVNVKFRMEGGPTGLENPIMNKTETLRKGAIVGENNVEHFSQDPKFAGERNASSFPKDQLTAEELLPQDNSSLWAQVNPSGEGSLKDRNFLQSGYHIGINTVGQTLRNANLQLRSEPPCPQVKVSPWSQSTIEADVSRKPFEIGGCA